MSNNVYCQTFNISHTFHSDVVGALPVCTVPTTSSFSTEHLASMDWAMTTARWKTFKFWYVLCLILEVWQYSLRCCDSMWLEIFLTFQRRQSGNYIYKQCDYITWQIVGGHETGHVFSYLIRFSYHSHSTCFTNVSRHVWVNKIAKAIKNAFN